LIRPLRRYLVAGVLVWLPIIAVVVVIRFIVRLMDFTLLVVPMSLRPETVLGFNIPGLGLLIAFVVVLCTGLLVTNLIGRRIVEGWERLLQRIPFVRALYGGVKGFAETVLSNSGESFKKVLLIEYPRRGLWSIGFMTSSRMPQVNEKTGVEQVCVFIPTTPNPTSGFIVLVPRSEAIELDMSVDAAMKLIVTLGVVTPKA
jgi:uncharacterized membrane protein